MISIQSNMGFVAVEIIVFLSFFTFFVIHIADMLYPRMCIWIVRAFVLLMVALIFVGIHIRNAVHAIHDLYHSKVDTSLQCNLWHIL
jgi:hypothetical protein